MHSINRYAEMRQEFARVAERPLLVLPKISNELELQARWFAGEFGRKFHTVTGEPVEIVQFGFWNREAGPDFQDAAVRIAGGPVLHVFLERSAVEFFARTSAHRNVPQVQLDLAALGDPAGVMVPVAHAGRCV